ncbi:hypothetical protein QTP88_011806 [Uroleucon formosanum]
MLHVPNTVSTSVLSASQLLHSNIVSSSIFYISPAVVASAVILFSDPVQVGPEASGPAKQLGQVVYASFTSSSHHRIVVRRSAARPCISAPFSTFFICQYAYDRSLTNNSMGDIVAIKLAATNDVELYAQAHGEVITMVLNTEIQSSSNKSILYDSTEEPLEIIDYKYLYRDLLKDHDKLKTEINESLRSQLKQLQKNISNLNILVQKSQKSSSKQIKQLSVNKTRNIEIQARKYLSSAFSQNQLDLMMKKKKKVHWSRDEIFKAFTLRYFSKRAYIYVKNELNYPLLGISSLQRWAKSIDLRNGVLGEKLTVLMFDEVKVASTLEYDVVRDEVISPHSQMHKQQVYVDFDKKMTKEIIFDVIEKLDEIGFKTICCVSDCGGGNIGLWKALDINYENLVFSIPNGREIVYVPDVPHIFKLLRNWLLDTGFVIRDQIINKKPLESLISKTSTELSVCHKLNSENLTCAGPQRQKDNYCHIQLRQHCCTIGQLKTINDLKTPPIS